MSALQPISPGWFGRRVLVTGHTGFKGGWLSAWLSLMGAEVTGYALAPDSDPSLFAQTRLSGRVRHIVGDVRDPAHLNAVVAEVRPEVVFHLAAQPLVRLSYAQPVETYATNVMGTIHLLEAVRAVGGVAACICVTSDKCYDNREWDWPYRESDPMGGYDPYSSSKGCAELVVSAWRNSYFPTADIAKGGMGLATVRAGNVIGGGDWATDRLIPDLVRAYLKGEAPVIRAPNAVRPWQHVLEALGGYIRIAERLLAGEARFADAWNFGPSDEDARPVGWIAGRMAELWGKGGSAPLLDTGPQPHEAGLLRLDSSKARAALGWRPALGLDSALEWIVDWHRRVDAGEDARAVTDAQIRAYATRANMTDRLLDAEAVR